MGEGVRRWGEREIIYLSLHCYHQNDSRIKMGSDENHFNVSLIMRDKVTRQCPQNTTFEEKREPWTYVYIGPWKVADPVLRPATGYYKKGGGGWLTLR